ncbi:MAG: glycosyltransferase family 4 protein [Proteobacteria bacterium]|nr:glycosyltransferase family 4 protein [Pseudomonadota bacterium]
MPRFTLELGSTAASMPSIAPLISVSRSNALIEEIQSLGDNVMSVDTFETGLGALTRIDRIRRLRRELAAALDKHAIEAVVTLMPHVWTPLIIPALRLKQAGRRYAVVVHDGQPHPGDPTARVLSWLHRDLAASDRVVTLSQTVADQLVQAKKIPAERITTLFMPDLIYPDRQHRRSRDLRRPLQLLFFGRIMPYRGLGLFVDALMLLRQRGIMVEAGIFGEGDLGANAARLAELGARVENRWIAEAEIGGILASHDVMVLSHVEASQSGVAAIAHGGYLPIVVTPVSGLIEQVDHGRTGLVAAAVSAEALAAEIERLAEDAGLYDLIAANVTETAAARSMTRFIQELCDVVLDP